MALRRCPVIDREEAIQGRTAVVSSASLGESVWLSGHDGNPREWKPIVGPASKATIVVGYPLAGHDLLRHHVDHWAVSVSCCAQAAGARDS